jgi:hypothetical protein
VPQNDAEAVKWYRRAAGRSYAPAQLALGISYDEGRGVPQSLSKEELPDDVRADLLAYESACDAFREKHNCAALRQVADELEEEGNRLWEAIAETPAQSLIGVAIKIGLGISAYADMETSMQAAARADAMRLAGFPDDFGEQ